MLNTKLMSDEDLRKLFSEPLSDQEAEAMGQADEAASLLLVLSLNEIPDLMVEN